MPNNSLTTLTIENKIFYEKTLLKRLKDSFVLFNYGKKAVLPKHHGNSISWRKFRKFEIPANSLTEGVTPTPVNNLQPVEFRAMLSQEGDYIELTDLIDLEGIDPVVTETSELFGEQIAEKVDSLIRGTLTSGINVYYGGQKTSRASVTATDTLKLDDLNRMKAILKKYKVQPFEGGKYVLLVSPEVQYDLLKATDNNSFIDIAKYAKTESILTGEVGTILGFKIVVDNGITTVAGSNSVIVHQCIALGKDAFGVVMLEGETNKPSIIHKPLGSGGTTDPLDQRQTLGWKINGFATRILYDEAVMRVEVASGLNIGTFEDENDEDNRTHYITADNIQ